MLQVGIIGLPNVGKSTLFNALAHGHGQAEVSNYPFCTIDANVAVVPVPEPRLERLAELFKQETRVPATVKFVDIAGLVRDAHRGEGLGNQFLAHIREGDAILHVVRCFDDPQIAHVEGWVDPARDVQTVQNELIQADRESMERRVEKARSQAKSGKTEDLEKLTQAESLLTWLGDGQPASEWPNREHGKGLLAEVFLLTTKPFLYVANAPEEGDGDHVQALTDFAASTGARVLRIPAKLSADLADLDPDEVREFMQELGLDQTALAEIVLASYELLDQVTFFTGVGAELTAWAATRGTPLGAAAGRIHSDMQTGFIKAEVVPYEGLCRVGSWAAAREKGLMVAKGKDQPVEDGDVVYVHFRKPG